MNFFNLQIRLIAMPKKKWCYLIFKISNNKFFFKTSEENFHHLNHRKKSLVIISFSKKVFFQFFFSKHSNFHCDDLYRFLSDSLKFVNSFKKKHRLHCEI